MTLRHLRIFVTVCETGSMTAAAQILYIAQPAISLAVSEMEEHYKVRLFDRISRRLYLTDSGRQALEYARHIIALFDEMEQGVGGGQAAKELRIGTSITIGSCLLPGYIRELKERFPSLTVQAAVGNSEAIEQKLLPAIAKLRATLQIRSISVSLREWFTVTISTVGPFPAIGWYLSALRPIRLQGIP